ncbi:MAG: hypothetical protein BWY74_02588 [Firmicutes bacterium ADurb.Bin419]|nr:MAG: hypothetical protein BWY74_02588 [Firmicutes bacterium ADurb.Bin419]
MMYFDPTGYDAIRDLAGRNGGNTVWDNKTKIAEVTVNGITKRYILDKGKAWEYDIDTKKIGNYAGEVIEGRIDVTNNYFNTTFFGKKEKSSFDKHERGNKNEDALEQDKVYDVDGNNEKDVGGVFLSRVFGVYLNVNCYAYSLGLYKYPDGTAFSKDGNGGAGGISPRDIASWHIEKKYGDDFSQMSKEDAKLLMNSIFNENRQNVINAIKADAQVLGWEIEEIGKDDAIPEGSYRIMFGFKDKLEDPQLVRDFHFVRENKDGTWSSKNGGGGMVTNDGKEPEEKWGNYNYDNSRIYFYVKRK